MLLATLRPKVLAVFALVWALLVLAACQTAPAVSPAPTPLVPNNRDITAMPAHVAGGLEPQAGYRYEAVVQSPTELVVTVELLRASDMDTMVVRQKVIPVEAISAEALRTEQVVLESKILSDFDEGVTVTIPNATASEVSTEALSDWDGLTIPSENIFTFTVPLHPIEGSQAYALLIEQYEAQVLRTRSTRLFLVAGEVVIR
jgi:hypothetical protein